MVVVASAGLIGLGIVAVKRSIAVSAIKPAKGFGPSTTPKKKIAVKEEEIRGNSSNRSSSSRSKEDAVVPEIVTNRIIKRVGLTVGLPLGIGLIFFPFYYYLKAILKLDLPEWVPIITSFFTFGAAGLGITYGVVSTSWDPNREGSFLGWKEAQLNWPLIWQNKSDEEEIDFDPYNKKK